MALNVSGTGVLCQALSAPPIVTSGSVVSATTGRSSAKALGLPGGNGGFLTLTVSVVGVEMSAAVKGHGKLRGVDEGRAGFLAAAEQDACAGQEAGAVDREHDVVLDVARPHGGGAEGGQGPAPDP